MKMRLPFSALLFTGFLYSHFLSIAQDIHFNSVTLPKDPVGTIFEIAQDAQGYLWFATDNGLYKYDGYQYTSFHNEPLNANSPAAAKIDYISFDKAGYLWMTPYSTGLDRLDPATGIFTHFRHHDNDPGSIASDTVKAVTMDHEGTIWIGTFGGLDKFDPKTNKFIHYKNNPADSSSLSCNEIFEIYEDKQGTLWVGTGNPFNLQKPKEGGLNKFNKKTGKFTRYMHDQKDVHSLIDNRVRAIFEDSRGFFWVGTAGDGLHTMDRANGTFERHLYDPLHPDKLSRPLLKLTNPYTADHITFITEDSKGKIWIGTFQAGLNVYDPTTEKVSYYGLDANGNKKMPDNFFWTAYKTRDNMMWVSTWENNLYKVKPYENILPHTRIGKAVIYFAEDDAHTLWLTTQKGLVHKGDNGKEEVFLINKDSSSLSNQMFFIEKDDDKFWLTTAGGLYLFDPATKTFSGYHHQPGNANSLISDNVFTIKKNTDNTLWIGTSSGLDLMDIKAGTFRHFQNNIKDTESISNNAAFSVYNDKSQNTWVCTNAGVNRLDKQTGHFKRYLVQYNTTWILEDSERNLWVAADAGLFKYHKEDDQFLRFTDASSTLISTPVFLITEDREQNLWLSTSKGIMRLNKERNNLVLYGKNQGVNYAALTGPSYARQNGEILFGDTSGYYNFQPGLLQENISPPIVAISNFLLNNIPVQPSPKGILSAPLQQTKEIRLNHDQNTFSFEFANIDFSSEHEDTRLLYKLENYDNAWRKTGEERTAYYFNLPPGKYIFKVKAFNAAGVSAEKNMGVIISQPWWNTWWAYSFYAICFLALAFFTNRLIRRRIIEKEKIKAREKELVHAKEIEKAYYELKTTQAQLIQSEKMASLGELTAGIAHEIQNPLNFVNNFSEVNKELIEELNAERLKPNAERNEELENEILNNIKENEEKINHHGKRADAIVKGMLQHSRSGTSAKELVDINAIADECLRLCYHGFRAKDKSFHANLQTDFDKAIQKTLLVQTDIVRVLVNLYNNAFYAVNERRKAEGLGYEPTVSVSTKKTGNQVYISVRDNGNGIPKNIVDKIFQPFFTTKPTGQGTGLGLSLSYDIVKAHGGDIKVETKEREGSEFIIYLPLNM